MAVLAFIVSLHVLPSEPATAESPASPQRGAGLLLVTLDTTRADALGVYAGAEDASSPTPVLDALAARGVRYGRAISSAPLTLPAHASLLSGRTPPGHGVHDNATDALPPGVPTLATVLSRRGYASAAVIASRVLDRRFGLGRGFDHYDDRTPSEQVGEHGYAERTAEEVTARALAWLATRPRERPFFLWVHYYDPHSPYSPPGVSRGASVAARYQGEVSLCDRQLGLLLAAVPRDTLVAVAGDHGEALGEHGEDTHGLLLYRSVLDVPLILAGPGVPAGVVVEEAVASRRLGSSLLALLDEDPAALPGPVLPGLGLEEAAGQGDDAQREADNVLDSGLIYSETVLPASAYGWSPLFAVTGPRYRLVRAPRPELFDLLADPAESRNLVRERRREARRLEAALERHHALAIEGRAAELDAETRRELAQLGYLSGSSSTDGGERIDPKDGLAMLGRFEEAKTLQRQGRLAPALEIFEDLVRRNPENGPFLTHLASAHLESGEVERGLALFRRAVEQRPDHELTRYQLALALERLGRAEEARAELRRVLELDPRFADAWLALAQSAHRRGDADEERRLLEEAAAAGTSSAGLFLRLGQLRRDAQASGSKDPATEDPAAKDPAAQGPAANDPALEALRQATELAPKWPLPWLELGRLHILRGEKPDARRCLEKVLELGPTTAEAAQARSLLGYLAG